MTAADTRPVVVAFDGSPESVEAVRTAATLFHDRSIVVVTVWEPGLAMAATMMPVGEVGGGSYVPPTMDEIEAVDNAQHDHARAAADAGAKLATEAGAQAEALPVPDSSDVAETIASIAEQRDAAALVVGSRGMGRVKSALVGSTSRRLLHDARRPLLVVRAPE
jgi:nucleotide-binding universal stress UspA family protein